MIKFLIVAVTLGAGMVPALAESTDGCKPQAVAAPATKPAPGADGTAPGNAGSTGWSGGTGGSNIGTSQNGPTDSSKTAQPAVARGLNPLKPSAC